MEDVNELSANPFVVNAVEHKSKRNSKENGQSKKRPSKDIPIERSSIRNTTNKNSGFRKGDYELALKKAEKKGNRFYKG